VTDSEQYTPGPATGAQVRKDGEKWTLILVRELRHSPEKVWQALTDPAQLREWAPFEADGSLGAVGTTVKLTTVGAPTPHVTETRVTRADAPKALEYNWGDHDMRWELKAFGSPQRRFSAVLGIQLAHLGRHVPGFLVPSDAMRSRIEPMKKIARTLRAHRELLLNYFIAA
jgi:uncharacterized protein YndB with AHSA1/START domain